jgi:teichoic acid transport system ATP-binding protein
VVNLIPDLTPPSRDGNPALQNQISIDHTRAPTIIAQDLHITYRVHTKLGRAQSPAVALRRIVNRRSLMPVREIHAVRGVSFIAYEGEAIGLIGRNGSGKSTLLQAVAGLMPPEKGALYTRGKPSLLGVNAALLQDLSGERNVVLGCLAMGMSRAETHDRYQEIIDFSGIDAREDFSSLPMRTYSSGMQARLKFAIATVKRHEVLLIDEALATGDAEFAARSEQRMRELRDEAGTVFLVSHSLGDIAEMCERTIWLDAGLIQMDGPTSEVVAAYEKFIEEAT